MKKLLIAILVVLLAFAGVTGYYTLKNRPEPAETGEELAVDEGEAELEEGYGITLRSLDLDALYALHEPGEIVASVNGRDVTWDEYFYWFSNGAVSVENYMMQMAFYGQDVNWEDPWGDDPSQSFFDYVFFSTEEQIKPFAVIEDLAAEYGAALDEAAEADLAAKLAQYRVDSVGEEATDEEYAEYLRGMEHMSLETLETLMRDSALYQANFTAIYGKDGSLVSDEDTMDFLTEYGYVKANHILRLTMDMTTGEDLSEDDAAQKQAEAAAIAAQLQAIEDPEELLARLAELKETWDEDSGKVDNPDGYIFAEGEMVQEFYDAARALGEYRVSDPVLSPYGYHVIVRLPLDPDTVLGYSDAGTEITARAACANTRYGELLDERLQQAEFRYADGFEKPDLTAYLIEESF
ncbi:MAG: peptidylprolyl isomerase [Oscillospiraceae bacterium]|nr:peptidylprolyl isomerase [Oscillospiraceae bacterium]